MDQNGVNLLSPIVFASLMFGAMVPYWFSAMTMKSVGLAANAMVKEVARQWAEIPGTEVQILACFTGAKVQILTQAGALRACNRLLVSTCTRVTNGAC